MWTWVVFFSRVENDVFGDFGPGRATHTVHSGNFFFSPSLPLQAGLWVDILHQAEPIRPGYGSMVQTRAGAETRARKHEEGE